MTLQPLHATRFILLSLAFHAMAVVAMIFFAPDRAASPITTPVRIVNLPREVLRRLPPLTQPIPERTRPPESAAPPDKFGSAPDVAVPRTEPSRGRPEGGAEGSPDAVKPGASVEKRTLPFLTQRYIDELARKGMPDRKPGDDSVTLDTDEFKLMSYNRWLKVKVESVLKYPELAAVSGLQGTLYIRFDIMKDGSLGALDLLKSSGYKILDDEALRAIRAAAPFQPLPKEWDRDRYSIRAAVLFYLNETYIR